LSDPQQGQTDIFKYLLWAEEPDNITCNGKDIFWLAIYDKSILGLDLEGNIKYVIEYPTNKYSDLTSVIQHNNKLYLGSLTASAIGLLHLPDSITNLHYLYENIPIAFSLYQNYPNPFNPKTVISYQLPVISEVELSIFNILGQKTVVLVSEKQPAGTYKVEWDAGGFASGIYLYRIETDKGFVKTRKLVLLK